MTYSQRIQNLPPYLFARLEAAASEKRRAGVDVIDLGIGDPDLQPPGFLLEALKRYLDDLDAHLYPIGRGDLKVRGAVADWFKGRFEVELDPETEIAMTIGSKEALANFSRAFVDPGDMVGVPDPGYPVYGNAATILNGGRAKSIPLLPENGFMPAIELFEGTRLAFVNYPHNPTGAVGSIEFYQRLGEWADNHQETVVAHDAAYSEMTFGDYIHPSILNFTRNAIEFHSLSKTFNATGYRVGFAAGKREYIEGLLKVKTQLDSGVPRFIQRAAAECLKSYRGKTPPIEIVEFRGIYQRRKSLVEERLRKMGYEVFTSPATFYVWFKVGGDDMKFSDKALEQGGVVVTPGRGFGEYGKGFARIAVTTTGERLEEAMERIAKIH